MNLCDCPICIFCYRIRVDLRGAKNHKIGFNPTDLSIYFHIHECQCFEKAVQSSLCLLFRAVLSSISLCRSEPLSCGTPPPFCKLFRRYPVLPSTETPIFLNLSIFKPAAYQCKQPILLTHLINGE